MSSCRHCIIEPTGLLRTNMRLLLKVRGYEVNRGWWEGPHSTQHFIPLGAVSDRSATWKAFKKLKR
jgi:hypothetical protein